MGENHSDRKFPLDTFCLSMALKSDLGRSLSQPEKFPKTPTACQWLWRVSLAGVSASQRSSLYTYCLSMTLKSDLGRSLSQPEKFPTDTYCLCQWPWYWPWQQSQSDGKVSYRYLLSLSMILKSDLGSNLSQTGKFPIPMLPTMSCNHRLYHSSILTVPVQ